MTTFTFTDCIDIAQEINRRFDERKREENRFGIVRYDVAQLPKLKAADGFTVSCQASETHYCSPRDAFGPYYNVELGFPNMPMPELAKYIEGEDPMETKTVWGYVPMKKVAEVLQSHGGLLLEDTKSND